jgi:large subunit ribosomal protein L3
MTDEVKTSEIAAPAAVSEETSAPLKGIIGTKVGMTRVFTEDARMVPVTVISSDGVVVTQVKTQANDGYNAIQVGYEDVLERKISKAEAQHLSKKGVALKRQLREFRVSDPSQFQVGQKVLSSVFAKGDWLQVSGLSKGKGYAGVMKRHGFAGLPHSHGNGEYRRHPGTNGAQGPQHVLPGTRKPGHMGHVNKTEPKVEVVDVDVEKNLILLKGSIPGPNGNFVVLRPTSKKVSAVKPQQSAAKTKAKK